MKLNQNYANLQESYLFLTIAKKVAAYTEAHPDNHIIRMGIGDVTQPLVPAVHQPLRGMGIERLRAQRPQITDVHGERTALRVEMDASRQEREQRLGIQRRRHDDEPQVGAQRPKAVARHRQAKIHIQAALVEFVEDDGGDLGKPGAGDEHPGQDALGEEEDARVGAADALVAGLEADEVAAGNPHLGGNALGEHPRGESARLKDDDLAAQSGMAERLEEHFGNLGGLA